MTKKLFLTGLLTFCLYLIVVQTSAQNKVSPYAVWIKTDKNIDKIKGVLYKVGDSSLFIQNSIYSTNFREFKFNDIDILSVRNQKSVRHGATLGAVLGMAAGIGTIAPLVRETSNPEARLVGGAVSVLTVLTTGLMGGGIGALFGLIRDRYPLKSDYDNFNKYKGRLRDYSVFQEEYPDFQKFEHRFYTGMTMGFSFLLDEFAVNLPIPDYTGMTKAGSGGMYIIGYRITKNVGISGALMSLMFNADDNNTNDYQMYWGYDAWLAGPQLSLPVTDKFRFDFTPRAGYAEVRLTDKEDLVKGKGFAFNISGSMVYDVSKRCRISLETGYLSSEQKYDIIEKGSAKAINIDFGLAYKFGKQSL